MDEKRTCCFIPGEEVPAEYGCQAPAEWEIWLGGKPDDYTDACEVHVGAMLTDAPVHYVYAIEDSDTVIEGGPDVDVVAATASHDSCCDLPEHLDYEAAVIRAEMAEAELARLRADAAPTGAGEVDRE